MDSMLPILQSSGEFQTGSESTFAITNEVAVLRCPGERQPISRAIHLARLAAGFPECESCEFRQIVDELPAPVIRRVSRMVKSADSELFTSGGIRGRYINQLTHEKLGQFTGHILNLMDESRPGENGMVRVLFGADSRPSSPDLSRTVIQTLRLWGCETHDAGEISRPQFDFTVQSTRPDLGIYLTGGTLPETWSGLDIIGGDGLPWCLPGHLSTLAERIPERPARRSRQAGSYRVITLKADYLRWLSREFHALRPFRLVVACANPLLLDRIQGLMQETPCPVHLLQTCVSDRVEEAIRTRHADLGILIGRDGRQCELYSEVGEPVPSSQLLQLLELSAPRKDQNGADSTTTLAVTNVECCSEADLITAFQATTSPILADGQHRYWFRDARMMCDALLTMARALQALSTSPRTVSQLQREIPHDGATL